MRGQEGGRVEGGEGNVRQVASTCWSVELVRRFSWHPLPLGSRLKVALRRIILIVSLGGAYELMMFRRERREAESEGRGKKGKGAKQPLRGMITLGAASVHVRDTSDLDEPELVLVVVLKAPLVARVVVVVYWTAAADTHGPVYAGCIADNGGGL